MTVQTFTTLGGTATGVKVAKIGVSNSRDRDYYRSPCGTDTLFSAWFDAHDVRVRLPSTEIM